MRELHQKTMLLMPFGPLRQARHNAFPQEHDLKYQEIVPICSRCCANPSCADLPARDLVPVPGHITQDLTSMFPRSLPPGSPP